MRKQTHLHILRVSASVKKGGVSQQTGRAASGAATRIRDPPQEDLVRQCFYGPLFLAFTDASLLYIRALPGGGQQSKP